MNKYQVCMEWWEIIEINAESESAALQQVVNMMKPNTPMRVQVVKELEPTTNASLS